MIDLKLNSNQCSSDNYETLLQQLILLEDELNQSNKKLSDISKCCENLYALQDVVNKFGWTECIEYMFGNQINEKNLKVSQESAVNTFFKKLKITLKKLLNVFSIASKLFNIKLRRAEQLLKQLKLTSKQSIEGLDGLSITHNQFSVNNQKDTAKKYILEEPKSLTYLKLVANVQAAQERALKDKLKIEETDKADSSGILSLDFLKELIISTKELTGYKLSEDEIYTFNRRTSEEGLNKLLKSSQQELYDKSKNHSALTYTTVEFVRNMSNNAFYQYCEQYLKLLNELHSAVLTYNRKGEESLVIVAVKAVYSVYKLCDATLLHLTTEMKRRINNK